MKLFKNVFYTLCLFASVSAYATGEIIRLFDENEIMDAHKMNLLIDKIPADVYRCLGTSELTRSSLCSCTQGGKDCEAEVAVQTASKHYCGLRKQHPSWIGMAPNYMVKGDKTGYVLEMKSIESRLGLNCV